VPYDPLAEEKAKAKEPTAASSFVSMKKGASAKEQPFEYASKSSPSPAVTTNRR
jgi:hypothetical protein